jgi:alpha-beta hydrolase superfamily lysophospholipase
MHRLRAVAMATVALLVLGVIGLRAVLYQRTQHSGFSVRANGPERPSDLGLRYDEFWITSGDRRLQAWWVPADSTGPDSGAVLIFHGNGECLSQWVAALDLLHRHHLSCMVFDYSGFGSSSGTPSVNRLLEDGAAALVEFERRATRAPRRCAVGLSLGTAIAMGVVPQSWAALDGVALLEPFASGREAAVSMKLLPAWLTPLMPDAFDNVESARRLRAPLLIVHSRADERFPVAQAERIRAAAASPAKLVVVDRYQHADAYRHPSEGYWAPVVALVQRGLSAVDGGS